MLARRFMVVFLAGLMAVGLAGPAQADFTKDQLIRAPWLCTGGRNLDFLDGDTYRVNGVSGSWSAKKTGSILPSLRIDFRSGPMKDLYGKAPYAPSMGFALRNKSTGKRVGGCNTYTTS